MTCDDPDAPASLAEVSAAAASRPYVGAPAPVGASAQPGEAGLPALGEARAYAPGPKWFRFPPETWAMIRAEYLAGATAKQLALKWGVSPTSVYRHAGQEGFTKARRGEAINLEAVTRFAAQAAATEAREAERARAVVEARRAVAAVPEGDPIVAAGVLLRRAAGAALAGDEAKARRLAELSDALRRTHEGYTGGRAAEGPAAPGASALALASAFAWYDEVREACLAEGGEGGRAPSALEAAELYATSGASAPPAAEDAPAG